MNLDGLANYDMKNASQFAKLLSLKKFNIYFQNVNDSRDIPEVLKSTFSLEARLNDILKYDEVDVYALCEIASEGLDLIYKRFSELGYDCASMLYAPNQVPNNSCYYVIAWKKTLPKPKISWRWFTATPTVGLNFETRKVDHVLQLCGESFEKGMLVAEFNIKNKCVMVIDKHFPLPRYDGRPHQYNDQCAIMLNQYIENALIENENRIIIVGPNFNDLPNSTHMNHFGKKIFDITPEGLSFIACPWDLGLYSDDNMKKIVAIAKEELKTCKTADEYVETYKRYLKMLRESPLVGKLDHILCTHPQLCEIAPSFDPSTVRIDDYTATPLHESDHVAYLVSMTL